MANARERRHTSRSRYPRRVIPYQRTSTPNSQFLFRRRRLPMSRLRAIRGEAILERLVTRGEERVGGGDHEEREERAHQHAAHDDPSDLVARLGAGAGGERKG